MNVHDCLYASKRFVKSFGAWAIVFIVLGQPPVFATPPVKSGPLKDAPSKSTEAVGHPSGVIGAPDSTTPKTLRYQTQASSQPKTATTQKSKTKAPKKQKKTTKPKLKKRVSRKIKKRSSKRTKKRKSLSRKTRKSTHRWYVYKTVKGDTVSDVARRLGVPTKKLKKWNRLKSNRLKAKKRLKYYGQKQISQSIGRPQNGKLVHGISIDPDGDLMGLGFALTKRRHAVWGTPELVKAIKTCGRVYRSYFPISTGASMPVGNLSRRDGGHLSPHRSHQSGRDVDIGFILKKPPPKGIFIDTKPSGLHLYKQWVILKCFLDNPDTKIIIMERSIVHAMKKYIKRIYKKRKAKLNRYLAFFPGRKKAVIIADNDHKSHMHVRMKCAKGDKKCSG